MDDPFLVDPLVVDLIPVGDDLQVFAAVGCLPGSLTALVSSTVASAGVSQIGVELVDSDTRISSVRLAMHIFSIFW